MDFSGSSEGVTRNGNASRVWKGEMVYATVTIALAIAKIVCLTMGISFYGDAHFFCPVYLNTNI